MFSFQKVGQEHLETIFGWLDQPHMKEFWDNSPLHRQDIEIFANGRTEPSPYFDGIGTYWVGFLEGTPFSFILSHEESEETGCPESYKPFLSKTGKTIGLDFGIGSPAFLGRGLSAPALEAFMDFYRHEVDSAVDTYLIDPFIHNPRAIHVYQKAGFKIVSDFVQQSGSFAQSEGVLMIKTASSSNPA